MLLPIQGGVDMEYIETESGALPWSSEQQAKSIEKYNKIKELAQQACDNNKWVAPKAELIALLESIVRL